jgi:hypothetical protein
MQVHLVEDMLWSKIKSGQPLEPELVVHTRDCRECRDLVQEVSEEARRKRFSFSDLLGETISR